MITSITPLRVSLFGGGTDFPEYFKKKNCIIIGGTIDKYIYISLNKYYSNFGPLYLECKKKFEKHFNLKKNKIILTSSGHSSLLACCYLI